MRDIDDEVLSAFVDGELSARVEQDVHHILTQDDRVKKKIETLLAIKALVAEAFNET